MIMSHFSTVKGGFMNCNTPWTEGDYYYYTSYKTNSSPTGGYVLCFKVIIWSCYTAINLAHATALMFRVVVSKNVTLLKILSVSTYTSAKSWTSKSQLHSAVAAEEWCQAKSSSTSKMSDFFSLIHLAKRRLWDGDSLTVCYSFT